MNVYKFVFAIVLTAILSSCKSLQPETESARNVLPEQVKPCVITVDTTKEKSERPCTPLERAQMMFSSVSVGKTTIADLRSLGYGPPYSSMETVPAPEIKARLTKTNDGSMDLLDQTVRDCITQEHASFRCKMVVFTDSYQKSVGVNNQLSRLLNLNKVDISSGWQWEAVFVSRCPHQIDTECENSSDTDYVVAYEQFRISEEPPVIKKRRLPILDSNPVNILNKPF